jgi:hypothetical protein
MPFAAFFAGAAEGYALIHGHVISHDCRFADDHSQAMVDKQAAADLRCRMYFDSGEKTRHLRKPSPEEKKSVIPEPVICAIEPDGVQAGITQENRKLRFCSGIIR